MSEYRVSVRADSDLVDIYVWGAEAFGRRQAVAYQFSLHDCFEKLADFPRMGRLAPAIGPDVRRHEHRSHVILYEAQSDHILILAVLHGRSRIRLDD